MLPPLASDDILSLALLDRPPKSPRKAWRKTCQGLNHSGGTLQKWRANALFLGQGSGSSVRNNSKITSVS
jgi:hypothetical protein